MATRDVTIWTCDRCRTEQEHRGAPAGWVRVEWNVMAEDGDSTPFMELCRQCWGDVTWTLDNISRLADA